MNTLDENSESWENNEVLDLGSVRLKRVGRALFMSSGLDAESHADLMRQWRDYRPEFKRSIDAKIQKLKELLLACNPLLTLGHIALANLFANPDAYKESTHKGSEASVELAMSLAASIQFPENAPAPDPGLVNQCIRLSREILDDCFWYYGTEVSEKGDKGVETEIRQLLLGKALQIRGDAYWQHIREMFLKMFSPLSKELSISLGFTPSQFLETLEWAEAEINGRISSSLSVAKEASDQAKRAHELFKRWSEGKVTFFGSIEDMMTAFTREHPNVKADVAQFHEVLSEVIAVDTFAVIPRNEVEKKILDCISTEFGDNLGYWEDISDYKGWPLNNSRIREKPVIRRSGKYFFFHIPLTLRAVAALLASITMEKADKPLAARLLKRRDQYLEEEGIELLSATLQGCDTYRNLFFPSESGQGWMETDGLIVYGDTLIIIEAKAGRLSPAAWRGALLSFNSGVKEIVGVAQQQGLNVLNYLNSNTIAQFYGKQRQPKVAFKVSDFKRIFFINITLEQLGVVATHISWLSELGIIENREWPWVVNINDLRVITEIVEHPSELIHYLTRRLRANDIVQLQQFDELDFFMLYLKEGLYWQGAILDPKTTIMTIGYTEELDAYFLYKDGVRSPVNKPRQPSSDNFDKLITVLESGRPDGFVTACLSLYECDDETRTLIGDNVERIDKEYVVQSKPKSVSLMFSESQTALLISAIPTYRHELVKGWADRYSSEHGAKSVVAITWEPPISEDSVRVDLFDY